MPTQYSKALKQVLSQIDSVSSDTFIHVAPPDTSIEEESDLPELLKELSEHPAVNQIFLTITTIDSSISKKQAINHAMALSQLLKEKTQIQVAYNKASTEQALSTYISPNS
jgi:hypothetical protein